MPSRPRAARHARAVTAVRDACDELLGLVLPVACAGCGLLDVPLCSVCADLLAGRPARCEDGAGHLDRMDGLDPLPVWATTPYTGPVRDLVVAWKDRGRVDLTPELARAARRAGRLLAEAVTPVLAAAPGTRPWIVPGAAPGAGPSRVADRAPGSPDLLVVPAPSSLRARTRRGGDLVEALARALADGMRERGVRARATSGLTRRGGGRDQVGLGTRARGRNLTGQVRVRRGAHVDGLPVILVDDVLTSGATLAACELALLRAGARVLGAWVLAATPPPGRTSVEIGPRRAAGLA
jgi:predicted amidophosphoribosyltransferase